MVKSGIVFGIVAAIALIGLVGTNVFLSVATTAMEASNKKLAEENNLEEIEKNKQRVEALKVENQQLEEKMKSFDTEVKLTMQDIINVANAQPEGISIVTFNYEEGILGLNCNATEELRAADFAKLLRDSGKFKTVTYQGFRKKDTGVIEFNIEVELKGVEEDAEAKA